MAIQRRLSNKFWISDIWKSIKRLWIFEKKSKNRFLKKKVFIMKMINELIKWLKILQGWPPLSFSGVFFRRMNPTDKLILYKNDEFSFILWDFSDFFQNYFRYFSKIQSRFIDFQMSLIQTFIWQTALDSHMYYKIQAYNRNMSVRTALSAALQLCKVSQYRNHGPNRVGLKWKLWYISRIYIIDMHITNLYHWYVS